MSQCEAWYRAPGRTWVRCQQEATELFTFALQQKEYCKEHADQFEQNLPKGTFHREG